MTKRKNTLKPAKYDDVIASLLASGYYHVTSNGRVWTRVSVNGKGLMPNEVWRMLNRRDKYGYVNFQPRVKGKKVNILIHRMVYAALIGKLDKYKVVNHINGVRDDNRASNLELITPAENNKYRATKDK